MSLLPATLAATVSGPVWYWAVAALVLAAIIGGFVMLRVRRWAKEGSTGVESGVLKQLEELRDNGSISAAEFSRAQNSIVNRLANSPSSKRTTGQTSDSSPKRR